MVKKLDHTESVKYPGFSRDRGEFPPVGQMGNFPWGGEGGLSGGWIQRRSDFDHLKLFSTLKTTFF